MKRISLNKVMAKLAEQPEMVELNVQSDINSVIKSWQKANQDISANAQDANRAIQKIQASRRDIKQLENKLEMLIETVQEGAAEVGIRQMPKFVIEAQQMLKSWYDFIDGAEKKIKSAL